MNSKQHTEKHKNHHNKVHDSTFMLCANSAQLTTLTLTILVMCGANSLDRIHNFTKVCVVIATDGFLTYCVHCRQATPKSAL